MLDGLRVGEHVETRFLERADVEQGAVVGGERDQAVAARARQLGEGGEVQRTTVRQCRNPVDEQTAIAARRLRGAVRERNRRRVGDVAAEQAAQRFGVDQVFAEQACGV